MQDIAAARFRFSHYDAILILFYGGPESPAGIVPFLDRLFYGKPVSPAVRKRGEEKYAAIGGRSPIMDEARSFADRLRELLPPPQPAVYLGCLYTEPLLEETLRRIADAGHRSVLVFIASPFGSPQSCGRYRARLNAAIARLARPEICFTPSVPFYDDPRWIRAESDLLLTLLAEAELETLNWENPSLETLNPESAAVLFTAHSLPEADAHLSCYAEQFESAAKAIATLSGLEGRVPWKALYQSRSGRPGTPWLGPDIREFIETDKRNHPSRKLYLIHPIGFFFDNLETVYDLDQELMSLTQRLEITIKRAPAAAAAEKSTDLILNLLLQDKIGRMCANPMHCGLNCKRHK